MSQSITVAAGQSSPVVFISMGATVNVIPNLVIAGSTASLLFSVLASAYSPWPQGTVSVPTSMIALQDMSIVMSAAGGAAILQVSDPDRQFGPTPLPWLLGSRSGYSLVASSAVPVPSPADTNENVLATIQVPANSMGPNGVLRIQHWWTLTNNANAKNIRTRFSGSAGTQLHNSNVASLGVGNFDGVLVNRNATNSQYSAFVGFFTATVLTPPYVTAVIDTTVSTTIVVSVAKGTGTDIATLESYLVELVAP